MFHRQLEFCSKRGIILGMYVLEIKLVLISLFDNLNCESVFRECTVINSLFEIFSVKICEKRVLSKFCENKYHSCIAFS